jgi:hypothetical protein
MMSPLNMALCPASASAIATCPLSTTGSTLSWQTLALKPSRPAGPSSARIRLSRTRIWRYSGTLLPLRLPFDARRFSLYATWHARFDKDPGHAWLRQQLAACAAD